MHKHLLVEKPPLHKLCSLYSDHSPTDGRSSMNKQACLHQNEEQVRPPSKPTECTKSCSDCTGCDGSVLWFMLESRETTRMLQTSEHPTMSNVFAWQRSFRKCLQLISENQAKPASSAQGHPASGFFDSQHSAISRRSTKTQVSKSRDIHLLPRREAAPEAK